MKIGNSTEVFSKDPLTGKPTTASPSRTPANEASQSRTSATLSPLGGTLASLQTELAEPAYDAQKVEDIKQAIRDGQYQVNADAVADKIIASAQDVLASKAQARN